MQKRYATLLCEREDKKYYLDNKESRGEWEREREGDRTKHHAALRKISLERCLSPTLLSPYRL